VSDNPFASPHPVKPGMPAPQHQPSAGRGYVQQVPVIASLFIAQGVLLLLMTAYFTFTAVFMSNMDKFMPPEAQQGAEFQEMMDVQQWIFGVGFGIAAGLLAIVAILHFVAAYLGFNYKGRVFGIATMIIGLVSMITCYCAPTAIGLAVYGMIVYFNPAVNKAFAMGKSGMKKQQILSHFPN